MKQMLHNDWAPLLEPEFTKTYYKQLRSFLEEEYKKAVIYPHMHDIFNALHYTAFSDVKVVILGQDPYHGPNQAHGLSFSVQHGVKQPPSLINIFKELESDLGYLPPSHGNLETWAKEGVLLLNTVLTVRKGDPHSHRHKGWEQFTDQVIRTLNEKPHPVVYLLWGAEAQKKQALIDPDKHLIITSPHPSPLSAYRGFFGSTPFSRANAYLTKAGLPEINWEITDQ